MAFIAEEEMWEIHLVAGLMNCAVEMPVSLPLGQGEQKVMGKAWVCACTGEVSPSPWHVLPTPLTTYAAGHLVFLYLCVVSLTAVLVYQDKTQLVWLVELSTAHHVCC